MEVEFLQTFFA